eukprot:m51a1_g5455 hypothetical protein (210) ;mRNA; r:222389-223443
MAEMEQAAKMWRVYRTVQEMLSDRGYFVLPEDLNMSFDEFRAKFAGGGKTVSRDLMLLVTQHKDDPSDTGRMIVFFNGDEKVNLTPIKGYCETMSSKGIVRGIVVIAGVLTSFAKRAVLAMTKQKIELFSEEELLVNITRHSLVPEHQVLSRDEKATLLQRYNLKDSQLPRMLVTDPVSKYYGLQRGQVVKIIRQSETAGRYVTYRLVA